MSHKVTNTFSDAATASRLSACFVIVCSG